MLNKAIAFILIFFIHLTDSSISMEPLSHQGSPVKVLNINGHKIVTSAVRLKSGEIAYFGFEPIFNEDREKKWSTYRLLTQDYTSARSLFNAPLDFIINRFDSYKSLYFEKTQKHDQELLELLRHFPNKKDPQTEKTIYNLAIEGINSGAAGFHTKIGGYVAYVSKKPIEGFFPLPDVAPERVDFDAYVDAYDNLVMVVSSYGGEPLFQHRGIFRFPLSMLRKDYQGIGLLIHAFATYARSELFPKVQIMSVNPDANLLMAKLLEDNFKGDVIKKDGTSYDIKVEALKKMFLAANIIMN